MAKCFFVSKGQVDPDVNNLDLFDDRTLASLVGTAHRPLPDGVDNDNPYSALPVERWSRMASWRERA